MIPDLQRWIPNCSSFLGPSIHFSNLSKTPAKLSSFSYEHCYISPGSRGNILLHSTFDSCHNTKIARKSFRQTLATFQQNISQHLGITLYSFNLTSLLQYVARSWCWVWCWRTAPLPKNSRHRGKIRKIKTPFALNVFYYIRFCNRSLIN